MQNYSEFNNRTIFEYVTTTRVLFLCLDALDFTDGKGAPAPRMKIRCGLYDSTLNPGSRITAEVESYVPIGEFLVFCHDVLTGVAAKRKQEAIRAGTKHPFYFRHYGGYRQTKVTSTCLSLVDGRDENSNFAFLATSGPGKLTKVGGIMPLPASERGGAPETSILINMPDKELKEFCLIGKAYVEQYIALDLQMRLVSVRAQRDEYSRAKEANYISNFGYGSPSQKENFHG